uniref:Shavenoid isoform B-like N-terminal domain-containing protein n=1 Tax=Romanomermis culicivorax TaxID=13658 RepID=A0A915JDL8_ROMCU
MVTLLSLIITSYYLLWDYGLAMSFNVTRVFNDGDIFSTSQVAQITQSLSQEDVAQQQCDSKYCSTYQAYPLRANQCFCQCPNSSPVFLQHTRQCASTVDDCHVVPFFNRNKHQGSIPTVFIPLKGQMINPSGRLDWNGALKNSDNQNSGAAEKCAVHSVGYLSKDGWSSIDNGNNLFGLATESDVTGIKWFGDKQDQLQLTGKLIQLSLQCDNEKNNNLCIVFRVVGKSVNGLNTESTQLSSEPNKGASTSGVGSNQMDRANQIGLIVGIACGIVLTLTLIAVAVFWTVCWRQQKERLARKIQLHVLYQQRMQQQNGGPFPGLGSTARNFNPNHEDAVRSALEVLQSFGAANYNPFLESCWQRSPNMPYGVGEHRPQSLHDDPRSMSPLPNGSPHVRHYSSQQLPPPPPYPHQRRRLNFSPEYFERELMAHPPPSAEEFLFELRRMIETAKGRIRSRRYAPRLEGIPEEDQWSESYSTYNTVQTLTPAESAAPQLTTTTTSPSSSVVHYPQVENDLSPVSSVDSGFADDSQPKTTTMATTDNIPTNDQSSEAGKVANWLMATTLPESIELTEMDVGSSIVHEQNLKYEAQNPRKFENSGFLGRIFRRTASEPGTSSENGLRGHRANSLGERPTVKNSHPRNDFSCPQNLRALDFAQAKIPRQTKQSSDAQNFDPGAHQMIFNDQYWADHPINELLLTCQALPYGCTAPRNRRGRSPGIFQGVENRCFSSSQNIP